MLIFERLTGAKDMKLSRECDPDYWVGCAPDVGSDECNPEVQMCAPDYGEDGCLPDCGPTV